MLKTKIVRWYDDHSIAIKHIPWLAPGNTNIKCYDQLFWQKMRYGHFSLEWAFINSNQLHALTAALNITRICPRTKN